MPSGADPGEIPAPRDRDAIHDLAVRSRDRVWSYEMGTDQSKPVHPQPRREDVPG
jgi:hypothetical protein